MSISKRLQNEAAHGHKILEENETNWGWDTPAGKIRKQRRIEILQSLKLGSDAKVLEIGCGSGTFTGTLLESYPQVVSIDISEPLLEKAKSIYPKGTFLKMDAHALEFKENSFDAVVGVSVLHHLEWDIALKEFFRVLKPNGKLLFSEPNLLNPQIFIQKNVPAIKAWMGDSPDEYAFTPSQIRKSTEKQGFRNISVIPYEFLHPSTPASFIRPVKKIEKLLSSSVLSSFAGSIELRAEK